MSGPPAIESELESKTESVIKTIQDIKAAFGQYTDEEIHTLLKESNMDPEETTKKLQFYESFEVVKRKERKEKKVVYNGRRGPRDGRYSDFDVERQHQYQNGPQSVRREKNPRPQQQGRQENHSESGGPRFERIPKKVAKKETKKETKEEAAPPAAVASSVAAPTKKGESTSATTKKKNPPSAKSNLERNRPGSLNNISSGSKPGPGPTPASTPTNPAPPVPRQQQPSKKSSLGNSSVGPLSSPSPSDPVVEPTPRNHGAIQRNPNVTFSGKQQSVALPHRVVPAIENNCNITFGSFDDTFLEKSSDTEAASKKEPQTDEPQPQPESSPPPQENNISSGTDLLFNQPKQEVLPPVGRSQQETQQGENDGSSSLQTNKQRVPSSPPTYPFVQNSYSNYMFPYYSPMYMPQVPRNVHPAAVLGHSGYANQLPTGAGAKYPSYMQPTMHPGREENKEENVFYNLAQGQTMAFHPPAAAAQGGFPSVYHQSQSMSSAPLSQQQVGGETVPMTSFPRSQLPYGGPYWNTNCEN